MNAGKAPPYWQASHVERRRQRYQLFGRLRHLIAHKGDVAMFDRHFCLHCQNPGPWKMPAPPVVREWPGMRNGGALRIFRIPEGPDDKGGLVSALRDLVSRLSNTASDDELLHAFQALTEGNDEEKKQ